MEDKGESSARKIPFLGETFESASEEYAETGNSNQNEMVKLETVEYDYDNLRMMTIKKNMDPQIFQTQVNCRTRNMGQMSQPSSKQKKTQ